MPVGALAVPPMDASTSCGGRLTVQPCAGTVSLGCWWCSAGGGGGRSSGSGSHSSGAVPPRADRGFDRCRGGYPGEPVRNMRVGTNVRTLEQLGAWEVGHQVRLSRVYACPRSSRGGVFVSVMARTGQRVPNSRLARRSARATVRYPLNMLGSASATGRSARALGHSRQVRHRRERCSNRTTMAEASSRRRGIGCTGANAASALQRRTSVATRSS